MQAGAAATAVEMESTGVEAGEWVWDMSTSQWVWHSVEAPQPYFDAATGQWVYPPAPVSAALVPRFVGVVSLYREGALSPVGTPC